jgi:hypothetical protein
MTEQKPSFLSRISLALRVLFNAQLAAQLMRLIRREAVEKPELEKAPAPVLKEASPDAALQLLGLLQRDGRLVDFIEEDVAGFSDTQVGAAARVVHEGCRKVLREHFTIEAVRSEPEGSRITLAQGFDASAVRLTGNVVGEPPFSGTLTHRGWRVVKVQLPKLAPGHDASILAPAEVEL